MEELWNLLIVMIVCNAAFGFFYVGMHRRGLDYINGYLWTGAYFLGIAALTSYFFWGYIAEILRDFSIVPLVALGVFALAHLAWSLSVPAVLPRPTEYFAQYPDRYYLKIDWRRSIAKSMDILAQQVFIVLLVLFLKELGLSLTHITLAFLGLFALLHVPLIASERGAWPSWLFAGIVFVFSMLFPFLILTVSYGFVYTYILHWLFYMITATIFWLIYAKRPKAI